MFKLDVVIIFTKHAENKFAILKAHKFFVSKDQVLKTLKHPDLLDYSRLPLLIAQRKIDKNRVLRVVYKKKGKNLIVITFYPGKIKQYG